MFRSCYPERLRDRCAPAALLLLFAAASVLACGDDDDDGDAATSVATTQSTPAATSEATPATTPTPAATGPDAPSAVAISGEIPDLDTPVPPGGGELGRITVSWQDNSTDEDGFRIYNDCSGTISVLAEVAAGETKLGPLQSCRPGRVGVSSFNATGSSEIVWAP